MSDGQKHTIASLHTRVSKLEDLANDVTKIKNLIKGYAPVVLAVLVANQWIGEKFAALMTAIIGT